MSTYGAVLLTMFIIGVIQACIGGSLTENGNYEGTALLVAGLILVGVSALLALGWGFGSGWSFT